MVVTLAILKWRPVGSKRLTYAPFTDVDHTCHYVELFNDSPRRFVQICCSTGHNDK